MAALEHLTPDRILAARRALEGAGISDPTDALVDAADTALLGAADSLERDPDASTDDSHEIADTIAIGTGLAEIAGSVDALEYPSELAAPDAGIRERATAIVYEVMSSIADAYLEDNRPDPADLSWADVPARKHGETPIGHAGAEHGFVYVRAELRDRDAGLELAISGTTRDSGGQIDMHIRPEMIEPAPGWTPADIERLFAIWRRWHLNGMRAGCEHQRRNGVRTLSYPCRVCGYRYGSAWIHEDLPADVVDWIRERFPQ